MATAFEVLTRLPGAPEQAFDLSLDVDAHTGSMAKSDEVAIGGITHGRLSLGDHVTWQARHFGFRWTMTSKITEWDRPHRFVDEQLSGPFAEFRHEHVFERAGDGGSRMLDRIAFRAPVGVLGLVAERLFLDRYIRRLIEARNAYLRAELSRPAEPPMSD